MRTQIPSLAPGEDAYDATVHIVLDDFGRLGRAYCETEEVAAGKASIVENILNGECARDFVERVTGREATVVV